MVIESLWDFPPWATQDGRVLMVAVLALWVGSFSQQEKRTGSATRS